MEQIKKIKNQLFNLLYAGNKYYCLYCNKSFSKFRHSGHKQEIFNKYKISGAGYRKNVKCPNCNSTDRSRLLLLYLQLRTDIFNKKTKVLHISPNAELGKILNKNKNIEYLCSALYPADFKEFDAIKLDITNIEFEENQFDLVICNHVLEHVRNDNLALSEIYRILKPKGFAILQVPMAINLKETIEDESIKSEKDRKKLYGQKDHLRLYGLDYFDKLQNAGFRVIRDNPYENQWLDDIEKHCLNKIEDVIIGVKD